MCVCVFTIALLISLIILYVKIWGTFFYVNIHANTSTCACVRNKCVEGLLSTVTAIKH